MAVSGVRVYGIVAVPANTHEPEQVPGTHLVTVRELGAVVRSAPFARVQPTEPEIDEYHRVVDAVFDRVTVVPAPFGTVFRSADQVARWIDTHYIALTEGMMFVDGRCEARVHITAGEEGADDDERADRVAVAAESFRALRRQAAAAVPLRVENARAVLSSAFLVERTRWDEFVGAVAEQGRRRASLRFDVTGQWPPYDFVRLELGA